MKKHNKFKSAEEKRTLMQLAQDWEKLKQKHQTRPIGVVQKQKRTINPRVAELRQHGSVDSGVTGAVTLGTETKVYTGDKMIGIATMHKSNLVPIFDSSAAEDVAKMRR